MIKLFLLTVGLLMFSSNCFADVACVRIDTSVNTIPTTYSTASTSLVLQGVRQARTMVVDNRQASEVAVNCSAGPNTAPSNTGSNVVYVAGSTAWVLDAVNLSGYCYVRSNSGSAITSGIVQICLEGN